MKYHVLPGDSLTENFEKTNLEGEIIVCRECLVVGDLKAEDLNDFWNVRADFLEKNYGGNGNFYAENVQTEFEKLLNVSADDEINLWFEHELFCQTNLWFCLSLLGETEAEIYRVAPFAGNENDLWRGFGGLSAEDLEKCFEQRIRLTRDDIHFGKRLWKTFCAKDLKNISNFETRETFPFLEKALQAAGELESRPKEKVREIIEHGETDFGKVFQKFNETEAVYGFGDLQVKKIYDELI